MATEQNDDIFGLGRTGKDLGEPESEDDGQPFVDEQPAPEEPEAPEPEAEEPEAPEPEGEPEEQPAPAAETPAEPLPEDVEPGRYGEQEYKNLQGMFTRFRQEQIQKDAEMAEMKAAMQQVAPLVQKLIEQRDQPPPDPETLEQRQQAQQLQKYIDDRVDARLRPTQQKAEAQQEYKDAQDAIATWRKESEITAYSEEDYAVAALSKELNLNVTNLASLQIATEAVRNPHLAMVLQAHPELVDSDIKMEYARAQARVLAASAPNTDQGAGTTGAPVTTRRVHVETGGAKAPAGGTTPSEAPEMDEALEALKKSRGDSVFFGR